MHLGFEGVCVRPGSDNTTAREQPRTEDGGRQRSVEREKLPGGKEEKEREEKQEGG